MCSAAGVIRLGVALLIALAVSLGAISVAAQVNPGVLQRVLGTPADQAYGHWFIVSLAGGLCLTIAWASIVRIPLRWSRAGAWLSHLGVLVLVIGGWWYGRHVLAGECLSVLTPDGWSAIDRVYLNGRHAICVQAFDRPGQAAAGRSWQVPLDIPRADQTAALRTNLGLACSGCMPDADRWSGIRATVKAYHPHVRLEGVWRDTSPNPVAAVMVEIADSSGPRQVMLSPDHRAYETRGKGYVLMFMAGAADALEKVLSAASQPDTMPAPPIDGQDVAVILTSDESEPILLVARPTGKYERFALPLGKPVEVTLGGSPVKFALARRMDHAAVVYEAQPAEVDDPMAGPAVQVEFTAEGWSQSTWLPYSSFPHMDTPLRMDIPGGRRLELAFGRESVALPRRLTVLDATYQAQDGSSVPKDYRCDVMVGGGPGAERSTVRLNHPLWIDPFWISQGSWMPPGGEPMEITFLAMTRPGLPVIWTGLAMIVVGMAWGFFLKSLSE